MNILLKKMRPAALAAFALLALAPLGCGRKPTIVGKWQGTTNQQGATVNSTFDFTQDGKETVSFQAAGGPITFTMGGSGTYTVDGSSLTQNITTMTMGSVSMALPPDKAKPQTSTFTLDGDHLTLTNPTSQQTVTLTRVKE